MRDKDKLKTANLYVRITEKQLELIDKMASKNYRSRADEIRKMVDEYTKNKKAEL